MTQDYLNAYTELLEQHFLRPGEAWFEGAYRLGQTLVRANYELEDVVELHDTALQRLAQKHPDADFTAERGHYLLLEVLTAYAMAFKAQSELLNLRSQALAESEQKYRALVDRAHDGILIVQDGTIIFANPKMEEMTSYDAETLLAMDVDSLLQSQELLAHINSAADVTSPPLFTMAYLQTAIGQTPVEASAGFITYDRKPAVMIVVRDLTERMELQRRLQSRTKRLSALNRIAGAVSATLDLEALLETVYNEIQPLFQPDAFFIALYEPEERIIDFHFLIDEGQRAVPMRQPLDRSLTAHVIRSKQPLLISNRDEIYARFPHIERWGTQKVSETWLGVPMRVGEQLIGVISVQAYNDHAYDDEDMELLGTIADQVAVAIANARLYAQAQKEIAQRKAAEEALRMYSQDLESLVAERTKALQEAQEQILRQEKLAVIGQLAASISHELRNPLGVITNAIYYLKMVLSNENEKVQEYLNLIEEQALKTAKIASNLLEFTRSRPPQPSTISLDEFLPHLLRLVPPPVSVQIDLQIPAKLPPLYVDRTHLEQILTNLLSNAYQAMPHGGRVTITAEAAGNAVHLAVSDTGEGMTEEVIAQIFEPLFTTKAQGIGLGLAITKNLVTANGGRIEVQSEPDKGSTFIVTLPGVKQANKH